MPGPIVELRKMPLTYLPLAADGLALSTELMTVMALSTSFCGSNESLPTGTWTSAVLSVRNSTLPALISRMAETTSVETVPVLGFGMRPLGPSTLPRRPTDFIMSGVAIRASKAVQPSFWIFSTMSSPPANSAPAASASAILSPEAMTAAILVLAGRGAGCVWVGWGGGGGGGGGGAGLGGGGGGARGACGVGGCGLAPGGG